MNSAAPILEWFRGWHRGYKFGVLLIAAWAPFMFPESPVLTTVVMAVATTLFFVVTGPKAATRHAESTTELERCDPES
jgi:hypothetical protein